MNKRIIVVALVIVFIAVTATPALSDPFWCTSFGIGCPVGPVEPPPPPDETPTVGPQGIQGIQGEKGEKGDRGRRGKRGVQGIEGQTGEKGRRGRSGYTGSTGARGLAGDPGIRGKVGENGSTGNTGATGKDGKDGANGLDGRDANGGIAAALALSSMATATPGKTSISIGMAAYEDATAVSIGGSHSFNETLSVKGGVTLDKYQGVCNKGAAISFNIHF